MKKTLAETEIKGVKEIKCAYCGGRGIDPFGIPSRKSSCQVCNGKGRVLIVAGDEEDILKCPFCRGKGRHPYMRMNCTACMGKGVVVKEKHSIECPQCHGQGRAFDPEIPCSHCRGRGFVRKF